MLLLLLKVNHYVGFFLLNEYISHEIIVSWKFEVSLILYLGRYLFDYNVVVANAVG
jgi:hypothetical protein